MNKAELIEAVVKRSGLTNKAAKDIVDMMFDSDSGIIAKALKGRDRVQLSGFGTFSAQHRPARDWRIPGTDKTKHVEAHYYPKFSAGKSLKDYVK